MRKVLKKTLAVLLTCAVATIAASCGGGSDKGGEAKVSSTWSTLKILRDDSSFPAFDAEIEISMAQNETEGAQLVVSATKDVKRVHLEKTDLSDKKGNVIPSADIAVYVQQYITVSEKTSGQKNEKYPTGEYPDMLLPQDLASGDELSVKAGQNRSITVEVTTNAETVPGVYEGNFVLTVDNREIDVPVSVTVWDIAVDKIYGKTSFGLECCYLLRGEMDSTWEMYINYYETMMNDYKINACYVPYYDVGADEMAESVLHYYDNPYFTSYSIPFFKYRPNEPKKINKDLFYQYLYALAKKSTKEKNLFDKCYLYMILNDEPYSQSDYDALSQAIDDVEEAKQTLVSTLTAENYFGGDEDWRAEFIETLNGVAEVVTCAYNNYLGDKITGYCPRIYNYGTYYGRETYAKSALASGGERWFYTAMELYPYPSCAIDDYMVGNRVLAWMKKAYDVEGYLYYDAAIYCNFVTGEMLDPYADPARFSNSGGGYPGDGYIFYPALKYGADKPIGSLRAVAYRDGQEDNALLNVVERSLSECAATYGVEIGTYDVLSRVYDGLFTGASYSTEDSAIHNAREELYSIYKNVTGEAKYFAVKNPADGGTQSVDVYVADGYDVSVSGITPTVAVSGEGKKYTFAKELKSNADEFSIKVKKDGKTVLEDKIYADRPEFDSIKITADNVSSLVKTSVGSTVTYDETRDACDIVLVSRGETFTEKLSFEPYFSLSSALFGDTKIGAIDNLSLTLSYGEAVRNMQIKVRLRSASSIYLLDTITMSPNETIVVSLKDLPEGDWSAVEFVTENVDSSNNLLADRFVTVSGIKYTLK